MKLDIPASVKTIEDVNKVGNIAINYMNEKYQLEKYMTEYLVGLLKHNRTYWMECLLKKCKNQYQIFAEMFKIFQESLLAKYPSKLTDVLFGPVCVPGPEENTVVPIGKEELDGLWKEGKKSICCLYQLTEEQINRLEEIYTNSKEYILKQSQDCYDIGRVWSNMCDHCLNRLAEIYPEITNKITGERVSEKPERKTKMENKKEALVLTEDEAIGITLIINKAPEDKKIDTIYNCVEDVIKRRWNITDNKSLEALHGLTRINPYPKELEDEILTSIVNNGIPLTVEMVANKVCDSLGLTAENSNFKEVIREKYGESGVAINTDPVKYFAHHVEVRCASLLNELTSKGSINKQEASMLATIFKERKGALNIANRYLQIRTPGDSHFQDGLENLTLTWINNEIRNLRLQNANEILDSFNRLNDASRSNNKAAELDICNIRELIRPYIADIVNNATTKPPTITNKPGNQLVFHASMHKEYKCSDLGEICGAQAVFMLIFTSSRIIQALTRFVEKTTTLDAIKNDVGNIVENLSPGLDNLAIKIYNNLEFEREIIEPICHGISLKLSNTNPTQIYTKVMPIECSDVLNITYDKRTQIVNVFYETDFAADCFLCNDKLVKAVEEQITIVHDEQSL